MLRRTLLSSLLQTALLGAAGGIGFAPGKAAARNNARPAPVEESEADLVIVGSGAAGLSAGLAALEAGVSKVVILEKAALRAVIRCSLPAQCRPSSALMSTN